MSAIPSIDHVIFKKFPTRPGSFECVIRSGGRLFAVRKKGDKVVFTNSFVSQNACYTGGLGDEYNSIFRVLVALGIAKKSEVDKHIANMKAMREMRDRIEIIHDVKRGLTKLGIVPSQELLAMLEKAREKA